MMSLEYLIMTESNKIMGKYNMDMSQHEGAPTGQLYDNLSNKTVEVSSDLSFIGKQDFVAIP